MARRTEYSREAILDAALTVLGKHDLNQLTARAIAEELKASTAPIYQQFSSMPDLVKAALARICEMVTRQCCEARSRNVFLDIGLGYVLFARNNPGLFSALFLEKHGHRAVVDRFFEVTRNRMRTDPRFVSLEKPLQDLLFTEMWIYSHGLAAMMISGIITKTGEKAIRDRLYDVGAVIIPAILSKSRKPQGGG